MSTISTAKSKVIFHLGTQSLSSMAGQTALATEAQLLKMEAKEMSDGSFQSTRTTQFGLIHSKDHGDKSSQLLLLLLSMVVTTTTNGKFSQKTYQLLKSLSTQVNQVSPRSSGMNSIKVFLLDIDTCLLMSSSQTNTISNLELRTSFHLGASSPSSTAGQKALATEAMSLKMEAQEPSDGSFLSTRTTQFCSDFILTLP